MDWLNLIFSAAGGGVLGLVGTGIQMWGKHKEREQEFAHELQMQDAINKNMALEMQKLELKGNIDIDILERETDAKGLASSIRAEQAIGASYKWVNAVRSMIRPLLTLMLTIMAFIKPNDEDLVWMASTAVNWWFGSRAVSKKK